MRIFQAGEAESKTFLLAWHWERQKAADTVTYSELVFHALFEAKAYTHPGCKAPMQTWRSFVSIIEL